MIQFFEVGLSLGTFSLNTWRIPFYHCIHRVTVKLICGIVFGVTGISYSQALFKAGPSGSSIAEDEATCDS